MANKAIESCIKTIEDTFRKDDIGNVDRSVLEAVIIVIYDTLCDARSEGVDWWERDEVAEQELRSKMFGNN